MRIIVETYDYGVKYTDRYINMDNFRNNVYMNHGYVVTCDDMIIDSRNIKAAYSEVEESEINSLEKVLNKPEVMDIWDRGTVVIYLDGELVFRIENNYDVIVDKIGLIDIDNLEFTDAICKYDVVNIQPTENFLTLNINIKRRNK